MINRTQDAVDSIHEVYGQFGSGPTPDGAVRHTISGLISWKESDAVCTGGGWVIPDSVEPTIGIAPNTEVNESYNFAAALRVTNPTKWSWVVGTDFLTNNQENANNVVRDTGPGAVPSGWVYGDRISAEGGAPMEATTSNWPYRGGFCHGNAYATHPSAPTGPGWGYGIDRGYTYRWYPAASAGLLNAVSGGCVDTIDILSPITLPVSLQADIEGTISPLYHSWFLSTIPTGTTINAAWLEVTTTGLYRSQTIYRQTSATTNPTQEINVSQDGVSFVLMGARVVSYDTILWSPLGGSIASSVTNGKQRVVDVTGVVQALMDNREGPGKPFAFGIMPGAVSDFAGTFDATAYLRGLVKESSQEVAWDSSAGLWYPSRLENNTTVYDDFVIGNLMIDFTLPDGGNKVDVFPVNLPPFALPS